MEHARQDHSAGGREVWEPVLTNLLSRLDAAEDIADSEIHQLASLVSEWPECKEEVTRRVAGYLMKRESSCATYLCEALGMSKEATAKAIDWATHPWDR